MVLPPPESNALLPEPSETIAAEEMIGVMSFLSSLESEKESQRLWALKAIHPVFFQAHPQLVSKVMMMLCHQSWPVKRQVLLLLQRLGREGRLGKEVTMNLQRLLYHPDNTLQLLVARILEHVPHADSHWKNVISDRNVAIGAVQKMGMALEFVETQFKEDPEIVLAAVSHTGEALQFAPKLCGSEEIVLAAVKETCALHCISLKTANGSGYQNQSQTTHLLRQRPADLLRAFQAHSSTVDESSSWPLIILEGT
eukprot:g33735.t1